MPIATTASVNHDGPAMTTTTTEPASPTLANGGRSARKWALAALILLVPAASLGPFFAMHFDATAGTTLGQVIYIACKVWILALPLAWWLFIDRGRASLSLAKKGGLGVGLILGLAIFAVIWLVYLTIGTALVDPEQVRTMAAANGIDKIVPYLGLVLTLTFVNALLEEYVWRWFVYTKCEKVAPQLRGWIAVILSAFLFTVHHIIALTAQMDLGPALLASLGVFIGGVAWSWCYRRYGSIWPGYISHIFADLGVFSVGAMILFG